jgi:hypothetical protein
MPIDAAAFSTVVPAGTVTSCPSMVRVTMSVMGVLQIAGQYASGSVHKELDY